ncbi:MAG: TerB family tellurite resistance protein [Cyanobium sp.]
MGHPPARTELEAAAQALASRSAAPSADQAQPLALLVAQLREDCPRLDDNARELILESAFRVACSDGEIEPEEDQLLRSIAAALGIGAGVLELEIERFRRRCLAVGEVSG